VASPPVPPPPPVPPFELLLEQAASARAETKIAPNAQRFMIIPPMKYS
jgi:hypothetical protein